MHAASCSAFILSAAAWAAAAPPPPSAAPGPEDRPWWRDAVVYHVFVRSFADSAEGPLANDGVGDLRGLIERLDYINDGDPATDTDLGATALWLMPVMESPSYHGYDVVDYQAVDAEYGTNQDFRDLVAACRERGIRVVLDLVINHTSSQHPWFREALDPDSPKRDWYVWAPGNPGHPDTRHLWRPQDNPQTRSALRDPLRAPRGSSDEHGADPHYFAFFWAGMPDLNLRNPDATAAVHDFSRFWLEEMGADGFRLDAVKHLIEDGPVWENTPETIAWLGDYRAFLRGVDPDAFVVGEVWAPTEQVKRYVPGGLDAAFEFDVASAIIRGVRERQAAPIADALARAWDAYPEGQFATFLANHDQPRLLTQLGGDRDGAKLAAAIQLTAPGIPFIYYGEEIGMSGDKPDPNIRTPMQWTADPAAAGFTAGEPWRAPQPDTPRVNVAAQHDDPDSLLNLYRRLVRLRPRAAPGEGAPETLEIIATDNPRVLAFERRVDTPSGDRTVLLVANLGDEDAPIPPALRERMGDIAVIAGVGAESPALGKPPATLHARTAYVVTPP